MKVFTDKMETSFFNTNNYIKNLHSIEINSIKDFVYKYSIDPLVLLGSKEWMITRFDELKSGNTIIDTSDEPEILGKCLEVDFIAEMKTFDIFCEISKYVNIDDDFVAELRKCGVVTEIKQDWINDDEDEKFEITVQDDTRKMTVIIDCNDQAAVSFKNIED